MVSSAGQRSLWKRDGSCRMKAKVQKLIREEGVRLGLHIDTSRIVKYLKDREKKEGGFSFAPDLYPDVEDTYYAIRTLQLLEVEIDRGKTANYLKSINWSDVNFPRAIYRIIYLHLSAGMKLPVPLIDLLRKDWSRFQPLDAQYFSNEVLKLLNIPFKPLSSSSLFQFHPDDNLQSLQKKVSILLDLKIDFDKQEIIRWVQLCQSGDGGFGFHTGTKTSYMENIYCALEILSKLQSSPRRIDACREYILGCQTKSGGFGRAHSSFPFIESTFQAVAGLFMLEKMVRGAT